MIQSKKITKITKIQKRKKLIDIETDNNHLFFANNILTHNSAVSATNHTHEHIAGGISKINESDVYWSILMTDSMKAAGQVAFTFQKTRNSDGVGKTVYLKWHGPTLRILNEDGNKQQLKFNKKQESTSTEDDDTNQRSSSLLDLMSNLK